MARFRVGGSECRTTRAGVTSDSSAYVVLSRMGRILFKVVNVKFFFCSKLPERRIEQGSLYRLF